MWVTLPCFYTAPNSMTDNLCLLLRRVCYLKSGMSHPWSLSKPLNDDISGSAFICTAWIIVCLPWRLGHTSNYLYVCPLLLGRVALVRGIAAFPCTICRSVRMSACPMHCGKTADRIRMPFGIIGRTGPGMRQVVRFGDRSTERGTFGAHLGRAIVTNGEFTALVCDSASTVGAAVWGGACGGPVHCCIRWGVHVVQREGEVWGFCSIFSQREMSLGRRRWNVSDSYGKASHHFHSQHFRSANVLLESPIRGLFAVYIVSR